MLRITKTLALVCGLSLGISCSAESAEQGNSSTSGDVDDTGEPYGSGGAVGSGGASQRLPLGAPCVPWSEEMKDLSGSPGVDLSTEYERCEGRLCLSHHFQGRVGCPYGQTREDLALPPDHPRRCRTTDPTTGQTTATPVEVPVPPQLIARRAEDVVHCTCRCAGPDPNAEYCTCPSGMECVDLIKDLGVGWNHLVGSYCIHPGTADAQSTASSPTCDAEGTTAETDCGNDRRNP